MIYACRQKSTFELFFSTLRETRPKRGYYLLKEIGSLYLNVKIAGMRIENNFKGHYIEELPN